MRDITQTKHAAPLLSYRYSDGSTMFFVAVESRWLLLRKIQEKVEHSVPDTDDAEALPEMAQHRYEVWATCRPGALASGIREAQETFLKESYVIKEMEVPYE